MCYTLIYYCSLLCVLYIDLLLCLIMCVIHWFIIVPYYVCYTLIYYCALLCVLYIDLLLFLIMCVIHWFIIVPYYVCYTLIYYCSLLCVLYIDLFSWTPLHAFVGNNKTLFSMRACGSAANLLPEHIVLQQKSYISTKPVFKSLAKAIQFPYQFSTAWA